MRDLDQKFARQCGVTEYEDLIDELQVDMAVQDGEVIRAGDMKFTAIHLPGHTRCSFGFYLAENKLLLSSETLGVYGGGSVVVPSYLVGYQMALDSIEKACGLEIQNVLMPHYGLMDQAQTTLYLENARKSAVETAQEIVKILQSGGMKADGIEYFKKKFYHGYIQTIYPVDAMELNTGIMVDLIARELGGNYA